MAGGWGRQEDTKSGVKLIQAVEVASKKSVGKYANPPKVKANELENCTLLFKFLKVRRAPGRAGGAGAGGGG